MPTVKISELTNLTSAVSTDFVAIVNGGLTKRISISNLVNSTGNITISGYVSATSFTGSLLGDVVGDLTGTATNNVLTASNATEDDTIEFLKGGGDTFNIKVINVTSSLSASYVDYTNIDNLPTLVSGSSQITLATTTGNLLGGRISGPVADAVDAVTASYILASGIDQPFNTLDVDGTGSFEGLIISPTSSGTPSFAGVDGQMVPGKKDGSYFIFVYMEGAWKSGSLL